MADEFRVDTLDLTGDLVEVFATTEDGGAITLTMHEDPDGIVVHEHSVESLRHLIAALTAAADHAEGKTS